MKKVLTLLLVVALTAAVAVGGTMAYLTDTDEDTNVMTLGNVKIDQLEYERVDVETKDNDAVVQEFHDNKPLYPAVTEDGFNWTTDASVDWSQIGKDGYTSGIWDPEKINNEQDKMAFVKNKGDYDAYVRSVFAFEANGYTLDQFNELLHLNINETDWTWEWVETPVAIPNEDGSVTTNYIVATATYNKVLKPGEFTEISLAQIALDPAAGNEDIAGFGETYQILVKSQAIQADGFDSPDAALNDGFGKVAENTPFENDSPIKGIDLRTALHYLDGDTAGTKITANVTNVIYALNREYPDIVDNYEGTLVDVEQDVNVYAYYVPNGSNYDVYFLADDTIYSPKDSSGLYKNMRALQSVDTHNYDVSRVENMHELFRYCHSLSDINVANWDVSRVKDMFSVFDECRSLTELDLSKWDVHSAETTAFMFYGCTGLKTIPVADWNTANVTTMRGMFERCSVLADLDVSNWNTGKVTDMAFMFKGCFALKWIDVSNWDTGNVAAFNSMFSDTTSNTGRMQISGLDFSNWDTSSATNIGYMFYGCGTMESIDLSGWDVSNVETMHHTFADCKKMENYNFSGWDTSKVTTMDGIFNSNLSLKTVDVSDFDTQNVEDFDQVFDGCTSLENIIGLDQWDTSSGKYFQEFLLNTKVKVLDLSAFDMSSATHTRTMIYINSELTTIYVGDNWNLNPDQLVDSVSMFAGNSKLVGGNGTTYNGSITNAAYAHVDTAENPGYLTHISAKP